jgi:hypothetical protein
MNATPSPARLRPWLWIGLLSVAGCNTQLERTSYSPDFQAVARDDGRVEIVPTQCLQPARPDPLALPGETPLLVPGCASNLTLLQMVEKRGDVLQGRVSGPGMAAPVGRAAQVYIDGYDREELRRRQAEQQTRADQQEAR